MADLHRPFRRIAPLLPGGVALLLGPDAGALEPTTDGSAVFKSSAAGLSGRSADVKWSGSGMRGFVVGYLGGPQVGAEYFVTDTGRRHAPCQESGSDMPHERQRTAGEDLNIGW